MEIKILAFGAVADVLSSGQMELDNLISTDELRAYFEKKYPTLKSLSYAIAINKKIVLGNVNFNNGDEVALMPPFSGG